MNLPEYTPGILNFSPGNRSIREAKSDAMKTLEDELMEVADYHLGTDNQTAARDAAYLLRQLRKAGFSTIHLCPIITESPLDFEVIVDAAIAQLQEDPPEEHSIFRKRDEAPDLRQEMLGPPKEGKYDVEQAARERNIFFLVFYKTNLLEGKDIRERAIAVLKNSGMWTAELERLSQKPPEPIVGGFPNYPYEATRRACRKYRKKKLEEARIEWERSKQEQRKQEQRKTTLASPRISDRVRDGNSEDNRA